MGIGNAAVLVARPARRHRCRARPRRRPRHPGRRGDRLLGGQAWFVAADLSDPTAIARLAEAVGRVDILVNNAGSSWFGPTNGLDTATYDQLFDGNVRSAYLLTAALAPTMADHGCGVIISLASMAATVGLSGGAAYSATKAALVAMTRPGRPSTAPTAYGSTPSRPARSSPRAPSKQRP